MQIYKVGGAVRDELLGLPVSEEDFVVVGARPEQLLDAGFTQVGRDFPVFLHPQSKAEYALARVERKIGPGYRGFACHAAPDVTLEEDLARRDFTINAMARAADGALVDPYGGAHDLEVRLLRHVSPAFAEDPVRILRGARFAARFAPLGFRIAAETLELMGQMVAAGEADHLVPERVWKEWQRALTEPAPQAFLEVLQQVGALARVAPELAELMIDSAPPPLPTQLLRIAAELTDDPEVRFAACLLKLENSPETPAAQTLCQHLGVPNSYRELALKAIAWHPVAHRAFSSDSETLLALIEALDGLRRPQRFDQFLLCCEVDWRAANGAADYPQGEYLHHCLEICRAVTAAPLLAAGMRGPALGEALRQARLNAVEAVTAPTADTPS